MLEGTKCPTPSIVPTAETVRLAHPRRPHAQLRPKGHHRLESKFFLVEGTFISGMSGGSNPFGSTRPTSWPSTSNWN
ncbi:hypothetical protein AYO44_13545 [Planctomycetaceae bacterium SCGC AG-212-F19]|nr:hypothetical protein AYO44_13545 [Planctomycetaceae bacterium SCGC AG-212-F19]